MTANALQQIREAMLIFKETSTVSIYIFLFILFNTGGWPQDALKQVTAMEDIAGDWWVLRGLNCGETPYPGGYDWYPCQHERFIRYIVCCTDCTHADNQQISL
jgi:hypothetical protein